MAMIKPASAAIQTRARSAISVKKRVMTGRAATSVDKGQECKGS